MKNEKWFMLDVGQVEKKLKTNAASGLPRKAARSRWNRATGSFLIPQTKSPLRMLGELFSDFSLVLLMLCAVFALFFDDFQSGISVLVISLVYVAVSFLLYYRTQCTLESMQACFRPMARVIRGGKLYYVDFSRVVLGDVLLLERGDVVAADLRLVTSDSLRVRMRTDRDTYVLLEKYAGGMVRPNENDVTKLVNMLHAGSVIESGNARGIVTAIGKYTYLAAKTGGIPEQRTDEIPNSLKRLKRFYSKLGMISLLCVLPFCLISLVISYFNRGEVLLSAAFLAAMAIASSTLPQLALTVYKAFFAVKLRQAVRGEAPSAVRSAAALDRLYRSDYLFVLDGAALSDGRMHFDKALTFEGEVRQYDVPSPSASMLGMLTALYCMAEKRSLSIGMDETDSVSEALAEFCKVCRVDQGALAIRYPNLTYFPGNAGGALDSVRYFDHGNERWISLSRLDILHECGEAIVHGHPQPLRADGVERLQKTRRQYMAEGKRVMILSTSDPKSGMRCFVGMLVLHDGRDLALLKKVDGLRRMGLRPIFFVADKQDEKLPKMPGEILSLPGVSAKELKQQGRSMTYGFGQYMRYDDVEEEDVLGLLQALQERKKHVAVLGFSDAMPHVLEAADTVISCSTVRTDMFGHLDEEIRVMELDGTKTSASCLQTLKEKADILIARPHGGHGGLGALISLRRMALSSYQNLSAFFVYTLCAQFMRLRAVALPMLFGTVWLDARHILVCSFVIDLVALILFTRRQTYTVARVSEYEGFFDYVKAHKPLWNASTVGTLFLVFLPQVMDLLAWIGPYYFKVEFSFSAILYLHLAALFIFLIGRPKNPREMFYHKGFWALVGGTLVFLLLCFVIEPFGVLFDVMENPPAYALLALVPTIAFFVTYFFLDAKKMAGKIKK